MEPPRFPESSTRWIPKTQRFLRTNWKFESLVTHSQKQNEWGRPDSNWGPMVFLMRTSSRSPKPQMIDCSLPDAAPSYTTAPLGNEIISSERNMLFKCSHRI